MVILLVAAKYPACTVSREQADAASDRWGRFGEFVASRSVMFHAGVHAARWPLHISTKTVRVAALMRLVACALREVWCGLSGHDMVLHFEPERLSLRCLGCGLRTQGWTIDVKPVYRIRQRGGSQTSARRIG